ncbi:MAG: alginate lyase family protein [Pseudomonadota bacterium]
MRALLAVLAATVALCGAPSAAADDTQHCAAGPTPVLSLAYGSRYAPDSPGRSDLDAAADAAVDRALAPVDQFLRDLARQANSAYAAGDSVAADCVVQQIAAWARADALSDLRTPTARLTIGSRLAGFGLVLRQTIPLAEDADAVHVSLDWLSGLVDTQMHFWEEDAPGGAAQGNLRAWAALAAASVSVLTDDPVQRGWAAWSARYVMCKAEPDGSLPQEMSRGRFALHYQLHSTAPLVLTTALLRNAAIDLTEVCDGALKRIVDYSVSDLRTGSATLARTGQVQTYFDGSRQLEGFNLAWAEAYLTLHPDPALDRLAEEFRPLAHSKLGGDQTLLWQMVSQ